MQLRVDSHVEPVDLGRQLDDVKVLSNPTSHKHLLIPGLEIYETDLQVPERAWQRHRQT